MAIMSAIEQLYTIKNPQNIKFSLPVTLFNTRHVVHECKGQTSFWLFRVEESRFDAVLVVEPAAVGHTA